jgi:outer membrane receptor for ferrienterochelin and colicin
MPGIVIRLKHTAVSLDDVVVIGYQTVRRRDVLASVSSIGSKDLKDIPINSASQALTGRLAGVQVTGSEGSPNAQVLIRV